MSSPDTLLYDGVYQESPGALEADLVDAAFWQIAEGIGAPAVLRGAELSAVAEEDDPERDDGETIIRGTD